MTSIDPQITYFINITEMYFEKNFDNIKFNIFKNEFLRLVDENNEEINDNIKKLHILNPLFVISIYKSIKDVVDEDLELLKHYIIDGLYDNIMDAYFKNEKIKFIESNNPWETYLDGVKKGNEYLYDNDLFDLEIVEDEPTKYSFHLNRCYYWDIFRRYNMEKLGPILCAYDFLMAKNVDEWITFSRENTIAEGALFCDFNAIPVLQASDL